jgi:YbbR domain-containing protein
LVLVGDKEKEVRLHLAGPKSDLDTVDPADFRVTVDLTKVVAGKQTFVITAQNMRLPRGVDLLDVVPPSVELTLAELAEKDIAIKPQLVGKLPAGLKLKSVEVNPSHVRVLAPPEQQQLANVMTTPVYLESIENQTVIYCKVIAPPALHPVDKRWPDVAVTITVTR